MAVWTVEAVAERFREAAQTARRLPPVRVQGYFNMWPPMLRQEWERFAMEEKRYRFPPDPAAVDRMVEVTGWIAWLSDEQRHLVWMCAEERKWRDICCRFGCDRTTAWRRWQKALQIVAQALSGTAEERSCDAVEKGVN